MYWYERDDLSRAAEYRGHILCVTEEAFAETVSGGATDYVIYIQTDKTISFILSTVGGDVLKVAREWYKKVSSYERISPDCIEEDEEAIAQCRKVVDEIADWLIGELDKLDNTQLNTGLKDYIIAELRDE